MEILLGILATAATVGGAFWIWRKDKFVFLDQSFHDLQEINGKILESDENIDAAIYSVCPEDKITTPEARQIYIQYMRINRLFRAWQYSRSRFMSERKAKQIIADHCRVLKNHEKNLDQMLMRGGYPKTFRKFLLDAVASAKPLKPFKT